MACNCINKSQAHILEKLKANHPERQYSSGIYINGGYIFDHKQTILNNIFEAEYTVPCKTQKSKTERLNILMDFCPMCGKKYVEDKPGEEHSHSEEARLRLALCDARDVLLMASLLDKTNTCDKAIEAADLVLGITDHNSSIKLQNGFYEKKEDGNEL